MNLVQVANETIQEGSNIIPFDQALEVTTSIPFLLTLAIAWFLPLFIYLIVGATVSGRTSSGKKIDNKMIQNPNYWIAFIIFGLFELALLILVVFPIAFLLFG